MSIPDMFNVIFGIFDKGDVVSTKNFITTDDGRVIFIGGPMAGAGSSGMSLSELPEKEFRERLGQVKHEYSTAANEYNDVKMIADRLRDGTINSNQAINALSVYSVVIGRENTQQQIDWFVSSKKNRLDSITKVYAEMYAELKRRSKP